jgi:hypothetical protein
LPLVARRMAPMRDLICGGCELAVCDITDLSTLSDDRRKNFRSGRDTLFLARQSAMPARHDQPEKTG